MLVADYHEPSGSPKAGREILTDVLIIGGGLAGCATAYYLTRDGIAATVVERFDLNGQASGANAGSIHIQIPHEPFLQEGEAWARDFARTLPLMRESTRLWQGLEAELEADLEVAIPGGILVAESAAEMRAVAAKAAIEREAGITVELLSGAELRALAPYLTRRAVGGAYCPEEGKANPLKATPAFAAAARARGARFLTNTEVTGLAAGGGGYVAQTGAGTIRARRVVNCGGAEAGRIGAMAGLDLPVEGHPLQVSATEPVPPLVHHLIYAAGAKLTLKQTRHGSLLIGGGWPARRRPGDGRLAVDPDSLRDNARIAASIVPALAGVRIVRTWPAIVNGTRDWKPILGEAPGLPGFFLNIFPWMGFTAGPIAAKTVAELIAGRTPDFDLTPYSATRFGAAGAGAGSTP